MHSWQVAFRNHTNRMQVKPLCLLVTVCRAGLLYKCIYQIKIKLSHYVFCYITNISYVFVCVCVCLGKFYSPFLTLVSLKKNRKLYNTQLFLHIWQRNTNVHLCTKDDLLCQDVATGYWDCWKSYLIWNASPSEHNTTSVCTQTIMLFLDRAISESMLIWDDDYIER